MGRSSSKLLETPKSPLQELQYKESKREQQKRKMEKEQRQLAKLQKKQNKKNKKMFKNYQERNSLTKRSSGSNSVIGRSNSFRSHYGINQDEFNRQIENKIHTHLDNDLCTFIMNQISLTLQFFGNYESEMTIISEELLSKENDFNRTLEEHSVILANPLDLAVTKWIQYKPIHGPDKGNIQLLQPLAMYVIFENVDIARPNDANYDSILPLCKVDLETDFNKTTPCNEHCVAMLRDIKWKGYVRLKLREDPKMRKHACNSSEDIYTDGSSGYSSASIYSRAKAASIMGGVGDYEPESDYDYAYIAHLNAHHPLSQLKMSNHREKNQLDAKVLPESCVSSLGNFIKSCHEDDTDDENDTDTENDDDDDDGVYENELSSEDENRKETGKSNETLQAIGQYKREQERRKMLLQQRYLNSKEFMRYFGELMRQKLAQQLQIAQEDLDDGSYRGASIYTKQYELIPAIHVAQNWPDCAFQFRIRERPISTNPQTGQQFRWPTRSMIKRIESFGFHVIPMGYAPKRHRNPFRELEWRIVFPKAERYLEQHLTSTQVKVFMMMKALVKTFIEPQEKNKTLMFTIDHIRMHLFWECERNFTAWPEEFLGEVLMRFINSFMQCLRQKCQRDYFIEERNLFETIPEYSLVMLYSILADITANPLMHLMVAFRNLNFAENFFPKFNFKKMFENLTENDMMKLKMQAKNSRKLVGVEIEVVDETTLMMDEDAKGLVGMKQHREKTNGKLRRKTHLMRHNIEMKKKLDYELKRISVESIDVEFFFTNNLNNSQLNRNINQGVENLRRTNILENILDHLLAMAEKAIDFRTAYQAKIYLAQARRLCKFYHNLGCDMGAKEYLTNIHNIDEDVSNLNADDDYSSMPPALPVKSHKKIVIIEKLEVTRRNTQIQMESNLDKTSLLKGNKANVSFMEEFETNLQNVLTLEEATSIPDLRKSIKFTENVVEVHSGDVSSLQKPEGYSPVDILRSGNKTLQGQNINLNSENQESNESVDTKELTTPKSTINKSTSEMSFLNKFGSTAGILKNSPIANSKTIKSIASSTEKVMTAISAEEKRVQIREMLKRKSVKLKGAFNQSSES